MNLKHEASAMMHRIVVVLRLCGFDRVIAIICMKIVSGMGLVMMKNRI